MPTQAYVFEGQGEEGLAAARAWLASLPGAVVQGPDYLELRFGLFSIEDSRALIEQAWRHAVSGSGRTIVCSVAQLYPEAQNALLKLLEEPPEGLLLVFVVPNLDTLLPTVRSRVQRVAHAAGAGTAQTQAETFYTGDLTARRRYTAKLLNGKTDEARRALRAEAIAFLDALEVVLGKQWQKTRDETLAVSLRELAQLRPVVRDRAAPLRMILEHVALTVPQRDSRK